MKHKTLLLVLASICSSSSLMAKYTTLPAECHYIYSKRSDYLNKKDLSCYIKMASVELNKSAPENYGTITLAEAVPSKTSITIKYTVNDIKEFNQKLKDKSLKQNIIKASCKPIVLRDLYLQGLKYIYSFYTKSGKKLKSFQVTKKECKIN